MPEPLDAPDISTSHGTPEARRMQKRIRKAMVDFLLTRQGGDDLMTIAAIMTESLGAIFEALNAMGYVPTEKQFVTMAADVARGIARGAHYLGASDEVGHS